MAKSNSPVIENKQQLTEHLASGCKPKEWWRIGTEHEKIGVCLDAQKPLPYDGERSIKAILEGLQNFEWEPIYEGGNVIALERDGASVSLEPGGQFELSGAPLESIHQTCNEVNRHLREVREVCDPMGVGFLNLGFRPDTRLEDVPVMPKGRYQIMMNYMPKVGKLGREMMFRTCTVQTNLDFSSEADMVKKMRVSLALQPVATALFANSPFTEGKPNGYKSYRSRIWLDTDPHRTGMLPFMFEDGAGFESYVDYALTVPMYFLYRDGKYRDASGKSFQDFMDGKLDLVPGEKPTMKDWEDHISTIFPEVRLKKFLEMRGADSGPWDMLCGLPAFWVGLLYDEAALDTAWDLVKGWSEEERDQLRRDVPKMGLQTPAPGGGTVQDLAKICLTIAREGLKTRGKMNMHGESETVFLQHLDEIARSGKSLADELIAKYHGEWGEDITHVYKECLY